MNAGADFNVLNDHQFSPLYLSILNDNTPCVYFLLEAGARPFNSRSNDEKDRSPIYLAIMKERLDILQACFKAINPED